MAYLHFARSVLANLFRHPVTLDYPAAPREYPENTRGHVEIEIDECLFCGMCMRRCPAGAITVNRTEKTWEINPFSCVQCACCVENCPKKCLHMGKMYTEPAEKKSTQEYHA